MNVPKDLINKVIAMGFTRATLKKLLMYDEYNEIPFLATELKINTDEVITGLKTIVKDKRSLVALSKSS